MKLKVTLMVEITGAFGAQDPNVELAKDSIAAYFKAKNYGGSGVQINGVGLKFEVCEMQTPEPAIRPKANTLIAPSEPPEHYVTDKDRLILDQQDEDTLARWHSLLNSGGWPDLLPDPEPKHLLFQRRSGFVDWIWKRIGAKAVLRHWNCDYLGNKMTPEQFETWWTERFEKSKANPG